MRRFLPLLLLPMLAHAFDCDSLLPKVCRDNPKMQGEGTARSWAALSVQAPRLIENTRKEIIAFINKQNVSRGERERMIGRIEKIPVRTDFSPGSKGEGLFNPDAFEITIKRGSIKIPSELSLIQALAHEMAHTIDPCFSFAKLRHKNVPLPPVLEYKGKDEALMTAVARFPMSSIHRCLLEPMSLGDPKLEATLKFNRINLGEGEGENRYLAHPFCSLGRHGEGFCDLIAAEVVASYLKAKHANSAVEKIRAGLANVLSSVCHKPNFRRVEPIQIQMHPATEDRAKRILLVHPVIRKMAGCSEPSPYMYCGDGKDKPPSDEGGGTATR